MRDTKQESWAWLTEWVEDTAVRDPILGSWAAFLLPVLRACVNEGLDHYFRVGQSMSHIIFSTTERHGLEHYDPPPPRISLLQDPDKQQWTVAWSYRNLWFSKPDRQDVITSDNAFSTLKRYLADLWRETSPGQAIPAALLIE